MTKTTETITTTKTIAQLRDEYPTASFSVFDSEGWEVRGEYHFHSKAAKYTRTVYVFEEDGEEWEEECLHIFLPKTEEDTMESNCRLLDSNDTEELYEVTITTGGMDGETISVLVIDGIEYYNSDWQGIQPKTLAECADYTWYDEDTYAGIV